MHYYIELQQSHSGKWNVLHKSLILDVQESNKIHVRGWKLCKCPLIFCCLQLCFQYRGKKGQALPQLLWVCWIEERIFYFFPLHCLITPRISKGSGSNFTSHSYRDGCRSCTATHLLEYTCCATASWKNTQRTRLQETETPETAKRWWRVKMTPQCEMGTRWLLGKVATKAPAWKLPVFFKLFNSTPSY